MHRHLQPVTAIVIVMLLLWFASCKTMGRKRANRLYNEVKTEHTTFDVAIVPGYPYNGHRWDTVMKCRVLWAYILYKNGVVRNFIFSGGAVYSPYVEGLVMAEYARAIGIPAENIFVDSLAEHSTENVYFAYTQARNKGFKSIALVTDPFQSRMLNAFTRRRFQTPIRHLPFVLDSIRRYNAVNPVVNMQPAYRPHAVPINEREGLWKRFRGTMGANIPFESKKVAPL